MRRWGLAFLLVAFTAQLARADDAGLKSLSAMLNAIRGTHGANDQRDAGPELTPIKRELRDWVGRQLPSLGESGDPAKLAKHLNDMLRAANLECDYPASRQAQCQDQRQNDYPNDDARGYLADIDLSYFAGRYLLAKTSVGVRCGDDEFCLHL